MPNVFAPHANDPYGVYNFFVEWDGIVHAGFKECSGLDSISESGDYREGTDPLTYRKLPGLASYSNIELKRGISSNDELWRWRQEIAKGNTERRNLSIVLLDDTGNERIRWNLVNCWPARWSAPGLDATENEVAIESLELAHEGVSVDGWS